MKPFIKSVLFWNQGWYMILYYLRKHIVSNDSIREAITVVTIW